MELLYVRLRCVDDLLSLSVARPAEAQAAADLLRPIGPWIEVVPVNGTWKIKSIAGYNGLDNS